MQLPYSNMQIEHWNPGASKPLVLPVHVVCNTSDELIYENIKKNSVGREWLKLEKEHKGVAILCGSGPSLADTLDDIRELWFKGAKVFALNGAAKYLNDYGITPDYQVIIDAREETADLISDAYTHLFGSQVHPKCFELKPNAKLWHLQVSGMDEYLPEYNDDYCLIGGAASVGNTATCLAYAMGYREMHLFGYDSSHRDGKGHAFHQKMNEGDPTASVRFNGKDYIASLTMKLQAEKFMETSKALIAAGCKIKVYGSGLLPDMFNSPPMEEQEKYKLMWSQPEYRTIAPGEDCAEKFVEIVNPQSTVIDFGCGTGRGAKKINELTGLPVILVDFADNCRDEDFGYFVQADLTKEIPVIAEYGYCTDVMEHIRPEDVDSVIKNIMASAGKVFFQISLIDDALGMLIGQKLHLSVHPYTWWLDKFKRLGYSVKWAEDQGISAMFYIQTLGD